MYPEVKRVRKSDLVCDEMSVRCKMVKLDKTKLCRLSKEQVQNGAESQQPPIETEGTGTNAMMNGVLT